MGKKTCFKRAENPRGGLHFLINGFCLGFCEQSNKTQIAQIKGTEILDAFNQSRISLKQDFDPKRRRESLDEDTSSKSKGHGQPRFSGIGRTGSNHHHKVRPWANHSRPINKEKLNDFEPLFHLTLTSLGKKI